MKICTKCGMQLNDDALFCTACGEKLAAPEAEIPVVELPEVEEPVVEVPEVKIPEVEEPVAEEPVKEEPAKEEPVVVAPVISKKDKKAAEKAAAKADKLAEKDAKKASKKAAKEAKIMPTHNSTAAIAAFVISIVGLLNFFNPIAIVMALIAIIFSIAGIVNTGRGKASGRALAVSALILALVTLVIIASIVAAVVIFAGDIAEATSQSLGEVQTNFNAFIENLNSFISQNEGLTLEITIPTK